MKYIPYTLSNFTSIPQIQKLPEEQIKEIELVGQVLPFKTNNYVVEHLLTRRAEFHGLCPWVNEKAAI